MFSSIANYNLNLFYHASLALLLTLLLSFLNIAILFLSSLHTYIHPDDVSPNNSSQSSIRPAIRRPLSSDPEPKPRKKPKTKYEFDENKAQIFRLKLNDAHLQTRLYFTQFRSAFISTFVAASSLLLHQFLPKTKDHGVIKNGSLIPILLTLACVIRIFALIVKISFEKSASKLSEKQLSVLFGVFGFLFGVIVVFQVLPNLVIDFGFEKLDGYGKLFVVVFMACVSGLFYIPAGRNARTFWLGTDQIRSNLSIISCESFGRMLLYGSHLMTVFTSLLWINPLSLLLVNKNVNSRKNENGAQELVGNVGMLRSDFDKFRLWCLLISGLLQIFTLRLNLQVYLNEAVLSWYQRLHASKVPDLEFSRAKVFLHNHYLCLTAFQFFAPAALVLLFLGLSQINDNLFENFRVVCTLLPCSALVKKVSLFMAWWVVFVWALYTSASLALYRRGILFIS